MVKFGVSFQGTEIWTEISPEDANYATSGVRSLGKKLLRLAGRRESKSVDVLPLVESVIPVASSPTESLLNKYRRERQVLYGQFQEVARLTGEKQLNDLRAKLKPVVEKEAERISLLLKPAAARAAASLATKLPKVDRGGPWLYS